MNREIEFRGRIMCAQFRGNPMGVEFCDLGWAHGLLSVKATGRNLSSSGLDLEVKDYTINHFIVEEDTIGQYVGQKDFGGTKIYEGDLVRARDNHELVFVVGYCPQYSAFGLVTREMWKDRNHLFAWRFFSYFSGNHLEVIGNRFDNPELMKGE